MRANSHENLMNLRRKQNFGSSLDFLEGNTLKSELATLDSAKSLTVVLYGFSYRDAESRDASSTTWGSLT